MNIKFVKLKDLHVLLAFVKPLHFTFQSLLADHQTVPFVSSIDGLKVNCNLLGGSTLLRQVCVAKHTTDS